MISKKVSGYAVILILLIAVFFLGFHSGFESANKQLSAIYDKSYSEEHFKFKCTEYYDGRTYEQEPCDKLFINATGNYCDGELICQNEYR